MDTQDGDTTPEWRASSSLSGDPPSTATSSSAAGPYLSLPEERASVNSSDYSSIGHPSEDLAPPGCRDLSPNETTTAQRVIESVHAATSQSNHAGFQEAPPGQSLEQALSEAASIVQYNAKWFTEGSLVKLLTAVDDALKSSNSSVELYAAVRLIDVVVTYSVFPHHSLHLVLRFLARTYHGATRALKTKRLAASTRDTMAKFFGSHLGIECFAVLCDLLETALIERLRSASGYAEVAGALYLLMERAELGIVELPSAGLLRIVSCLRSTARNAPSSLCEDILEAVSDILENSFAAQELDYLLGWGLVLDIVEESVTKLQAGPAVTRAVDNIVAHFDNFEARHLWYIILLAATHRRPLPTQLSERLLTMSFDSGDFTSAVIEINRGLKAFSQSSMYLDHLNWLVKQRIPIYLNVAPKEQCTLLLSSFENIAQDTETPAGALLVLSQAIIDLLEESIGRGLEPEMVSSLFMIACKLSSRSSPAATFVLRLRANVQGFLYVDGLHSNQTFNRLDEFYPLEYWDKAIINAVENPQRWEDYEVFISRLPDALSNHSLFEGREHVFKALRATICGQLKDGEYPTPPSYTGLTKSDVASNLIHILTAILSYRRQLSKREIVATISVFLSVSGSRDYSVSIVCIHALSVCCYEVPNIMSSYMDDVIDKMSKMVTQRMLAIHVLQFLAGLSRLPQLFHNFKEHDFKKIFGVCGSYLQSVRGTLPIASYQNSRQVDNRDSAATPTYALPQYVYALAHHVICFWYITLKSDEREPLKPYIRSCLEYESSDGHVIIEDQGLVTIDLMDAIDAKEQVSPIEFTFLETDGKVEELHRYTGIMLITTETALRSAKTIVTIRRPSGTSKRFMVSRPGQQSICPPITMETTPDHFTFVTPNFDDDLFTYGKIYTPSPFSPLGSAEVIAMASTLELDRAIASLDRVSGLDSHKAGVIYVGDGQTGEESILQNRSGSPDYIDFVNELGTWRWLRGASFNTQGLDRVNDMDGAVTVVWDNAVTQLVFHIVTSMPKQRDIINRKKHIGNDAVNIIFNNSGYTFDFDTLPTQVTNAYVVIAPSDRTKFLHARSSTLPGLHQRFYTVQVITRPGYPDVSSAAVEKVVRGSSLAGYVRNLVLNECIFSLMWEHRDEPGEFPSSWRTRLHQLHAIKRRYAKEWPMT